MKRPDNFNPHDERNTKQCRKCDEVKSVSEFPWSKKGQCYEHGCFACRRLQWRAWYKPHPREDTWADAEITKLRACIDAGMTARESAKAIGRSYHGTTGQRMRQSLPPFQRQRRAASPRTKWPEERVAKLKALRERAIPFSICATILGTTRNAAIGAGYKYLKADARPRVQESPCHEITLPDLRAANLSAAAAAIPGKQHSHTARPRRQAATAAGGDSSCPAQKATVHGFGG